MVGLMVLDVIMNASRIPDRYGDGGVEIIARHHAHIDASGVAFTYRRADLQYQGQRTPRAHLGRISGASRAHLGCISGTSLSEAGCTSGLSGSSIPTMPTRVILVSTCAITA